MGAEPAVDENDLWLLSFYRTSEINGSLFFGQLARSISPGPIQRDLTKHFADEAAHAWYWTRCTERLGALPQRVDGAYQDQYLAAVGIPVNVMEILALTQIFERRVINQYSRHLHSPGVHPEIAETLKTILHDEKWHLKWIHDALKGLEPEYGKDYVAKTLERYSAADAEIYKKLQREHGERLRHILGGADEQDGSVR
jgi:hypothetical protein